MHKFTYVALAIALGLAAYAWKAAQPVHRDPAPDWQATITSPDFNVTPFNVPVEGAVLEAMILMPNHVAAPVGAVVFTGGSGDGLFQNYAPGFLKTYLQNIFLPRGMAVVYANKRGMGGSTGNWMNNTIEGRAADLLAVVEAVRAMPGIDPTRVGVAGHSQGGWVVVQAASQDPKLAFVLNFMGPLRPPPAQFRTMWINTYRCDGHNGDDLERAFARKERITRFGRVVGRFLPIGMLEFDAKFFPYETDGLLARVKAPVLSVYGGSDILVDGPASEAFLAAEFAQGTPDHIEAVTIPGINHIGYQRADMCDETTGTGPEDASPELTAIIEDWLARIER